MTGEIGLYLVFRNTRELLYMTPLEHNQYRLEVTSICGHLRYGDTIEAYPPSEDGSIRYRRVVKRSGLKTHRFILSRDLVESTEMAELVGRIHSQGGQCESIAGGLFIAHIPRELNIDLRQELNQLSRRTKR